jgi:hypothetical protein
MLTHGAKAVVFSYAMADVPAGRLILQGLELGTEYTIAGLEGVTGGEGRLLCEEGLPLPALEKFGSLVLELERR